MGSGGEWLAEGPWKTFVITSYSIHYTKLYDHPTGTSGFASIAEACARGRADLASRGLNEEGRKTLRLFSTWEITRYLIPVASAHFRRVLKQNPELPQGTSETEGGAKWFTLDEVLRLRAFFAAQGSKA